MNVAVICAYPAGTNTGMISVDLSFDSLDLTGVNYTKFCSWRGKKKSNEFDIEYEELHSVSQLEKFDKIIFWGDFLHWIEYAKKDWKIKTLDRDSTLTSDEAIDQWYKLFLLEGRDDLQRKSIIFGNTLYGLNSQQLSDTRYFSAIHSIYSNCQYAMPRDIFTYNFIRQIVSTDNIQLGCDCALLLNSDKFLNKSSGLSNYFLYSFGRSGHRDVLINYVNDLGLKLNKTPIELKWLVKGTSVNQLIENLEKIKLADFVITDIYHCAVNSNRELIKTLCIGNGLSIVTDTLSDKKKEIFYSQHFQRQNYIFLESIISNYNYSLENASSLLSEHDAFNFQFKMLNSFIETTKNILISKIKQ
jgi:hypothetical protein